MESKTVKQQIIEMLARLPDDIDYDRVIENIYLLRRIEVGLEQIRQGRGIPDEDLWAELLSDDEEEVSARMGAASQG